MSSTVKNPYTRKTHKVQEWAIERLKQGHSPNKIARDIKRLFGEYVAMMTIYRWRNRYKLATGEEILPWHKLNSTYEQRNKHKCNVRWGTEEKAQ